MRLTILLLILKERKRNLVLVNKDAYQRETLAKRPVRQHLRGVEHVEWVHGLFLFPLVLGEM